MHSHIPVLLRPSLEGLQIQANGIYIDATFGRGGHSREILARLNSSGRLLVFDKDQQAIEHARKLFTNDSRVSIIARSFADMLDVARERGIIGKVNGILLDLGVSSPQLDDAARGFSFTRAGPLDMRMDRRHGISAAQWLAGVRESELARILWEYGEERYARRIARAIIHYRQQSGAIEDTLQLAQIIKKAHPKWEKKRHPATRCFQAIRIYINHELDELQQALIQVPDLLVQNGRLVVISFHSLEDRLVKQMIQKMSQGDDIPPEVPLMDNQLQRLMQKVGKPICADDAEIRQNIRARSARLRIARRL